MDSEDLPYFVAAGIAMVFMWLGGGISMEDRVRREAVKANAAYWTVDADGIRKFHWITE